MATPKKFLHDKTALLLTSGDAFLMLATVVIVLLGLSSRQQGSGYTVAYRPSLGIDRYTAGTIADIVSFIVAAALVFVVSVVLSYRAYKVRRELAITILALAIPLLIFLGVVGYSLLAS